MPLLYKNYEDVLEKYWKKNFSFIKVNVANFENNMQMLTNIDQHLNSFKNLIIPFKISTIILSKSFF